MSDEPRKNWLRGLIGAVGLALCCIATAAFLIERIDAPQPVRYRWPHQDPWQMILVLVPAAALWCFYFAHHWRGRAIFTECRRPCLRRSNTQSCG